MNEDLAANRAEKILMAIIQYQPNLISTGALNNSANLAKHLAAVRATLVEELKKQDH